METNSQLIKKIKEGGYNNVYPIAYIDGIIDKESNEKLSDILIRYNNIRVPWQGDVASTRNRVPSLMRRQGIVITYITDLSEIVTEVYKGTVEDIKNNWADNINWELVPDLKFVQDNASKLPDGTITPEKLSPALQELISQSGSVVNMPDDEDLEQKDMVLKFKDRPYNSELASGNGYKILRKNWTKVGIETINLLTQDVFNQANTIYVIRYDFTLGEDITVPENCILEFDGGSIRGSYTITSNNTGINAGLVKIFNTDVILAGTLKNRELNTEWFGLCTNDIAKAEENANILNKIFSLAIIQGKKINFPKGIIYINKQINSKYGKLIIEGCGASYGNDWDITTIKAVEGFSGDYLLYFGSESQIGYHEQWRSISVKNINFDCSFLCGGLRCGSYDCGKLLNVSITSIKYDKTGLYYGINNIEQHKAVSQNSSIENVCVWKGLDPKSVATSPAVVLRGIQECVINTLNGAILDTYNDAQLNPNIAGIEMIDCNGCVLNACSPCSEHVGLKIINCNNVTINTPIMEATGAPLYIDSQYIKTVSDTYVNKPSIGDVVHQNNGFSGRITNVGTDSPYMKDCIGTLETGNLYNEENEIVCNITSFSYQNNTNIVINNLRSFNRQQRYNFNSVIRYITLSNLDLYSVIIGEQPIYEIDGTVVNSIIRANSNGISNNNSPSKVEYIDVAYCDNNNLSSIQSSIWRQSHKTIHFKLNGPALLQVPAGGDNITRYEIKDAEFELAINKSTGLYEIKYISGNVAILGNKILGTKKSYITLPNSNFADTDFRDIGGDVMFITTELSVINTITIQSNWMGRIITDAPKDINIASTKSIIVNGVDSGNAANIRNAKTPIEIIGNKQTLYINYLV